MSEYHIDEKAIAVTERLTEEGVRAILSRAGFLEPLYVQGIDSSALRRITGRELQSETVSGTIAHRLFVNHLLIHSQVTVNSNSLASFFEESAVL